LEQEWALSPKKCFFPGGEWRTIINSWTQRGNFPILKYNPGWENHSDFANDWSVPDKRW